MADIPYHLCVRVIDWGAYKLRIGMLQQAVHGHPALCPGTSSINDLKGGPVGKVKNDCTFVAYNVVAVYVYYSAIAQITWCAVCLLRLRQMWYFGGPSLVKPNWLNGGSDVAAECEAGKGVRGRQSDRFSSLDHWREEAGWGADPGKARG